LVLGGDGGQHGRLALADGAAAELDAHGDVGERGEARGHDGEGRGKRDAERARAGRRHVHEKVSLSASKPNEPTGEGGDGDGEMAEAAVGGGGLLAVDRPCGRCRRRVSEVEPARRWVGWGGCQRQGRLGRGGGGGGARSDRANGLDSRTTEPKRQATLRALISSIDRIFNK
jgi:hypothetical protein